MSWYYAREDQQLGPVSETEFDQIVKQGVVTAETLVWREGMPEWIAYGEFDQGSDPASNVPPALTTVCAECGGEFSLDEVVQLGNSSVCAKCKPVFVQKMREGDPLNTDAEQLRKEFLSHEASVKSVGILYLLGGVILALAAMVGPFVARPNPDAPGWIPWLVSGVIAGLAVLQFWIASGIRNLKQWSKIPVAIFSGVGLIGIPIGTLINGYILFLFFGKKGKIVFSDRYRGAIAATPHIKYRTSIIIWIFVGLLVALFAVGIIGALFFRPDSN